MRISSYRIVNSSYLACAEYSKDLPTYLKYCKDVVFAGLEPPHDDPEEAIMIEKFWKFYQNEKVNYSFKLVCIFYLANVW